MTITANEQTTPVFDLLTLQEVSEMTRIKEATLRWYRHTGTGPKSAKLGGRVMYKRADVIAWLEDQFNKEAE